MQINSAQDWLTKQKRRVIAKSINVAPPPQSQRTNALVVSLEANAATQRERFIGVNGGATFSSECCLVTLPLPVTNNRGVVSYTGRSVQSMSVRIVS